MTEYRRILLVEDDPLLSELLEMCLVAEGLDVNHAGDGLTALRKLDEGEFNLIVLDLMMPFMDGFVFLEELAAIPGEKPTVLVLSANTDAQTAERARKCGAAAVARKPVNPEKFVALVLSLVEPGQDEA